MHKVALVIAAVAGGCAPQTVVFRDTLQPGGAARSQAVLDADSSGCQFAANAIGAGIHFDTMHAQCMGGKGWAVEKL